MAAEMEMIEGPRGSWNTFEIRIPIATDARLAIEETIRKADNVWVR